MKAVRLYRPRSLGEALRDMVASVAGIWSEYRIESSHQRALRRRRRESVHKFEVRVRPGAVPCRSSSGTDWFFVLLLVFMLSGLAACVVWTFGLSPVIAHGARAAAQWTAHAIARIGSTL